MRKSILVYVAGGIAAVAVLTAIIPRPETCGTVSQKLIDAVPVEFQTTVDEYKELDRQNRTLGNNLDEKISYNGVAAFAEYMVPGSLSVTAEDINPVLVQKNGIKSSCQFSAILNLTYRFKSRPSSTRESVRINWPFAFTAEDGLYVEQQNPSLTQNIILYMLIAFKAEHKARSAEKNQKAQ